MTTDKNKLTDPILSRLCEAYGITQKWGWQAALAQKIGVETSVVSSWKKRGVPERILSNTSIATGYKKTWLETGGGEKYAVSPEAMAVLDNRGEKLQAELMRSLAALGKPVLNVRSIPVLGRVPAGFPRECPEEIIEYISLPDVPAGAYALIIHGESMSPTIRNGDYVIFMPTVDAIKNGDVVIVNNEWGESMCKRYREKGGERLLTSDNPEYQAVRPNGNYRILGKVIKVWRNIEF